MQIIISPAKKMNTETELLACRSTPVFLQETETLLSWLRELSFAEVQKLWGCNDRIARLNFERLRTMDPARNLTPAILSYEGIQYQYMAPAVLEQEALDYLQEHLRILSGFYGVLKPFDGVTPYRLEMQAKAAVGLAKNLYDFWGDRLYREVRGADGLMINLASKEYSKCIERYLHPDDFFLTCTFGELENGRVKQKGTMAKMARGEMVRYLAEHRITDAKELQAFEGLGYHYREALSTDREYVFLKEQP